MTIECSSIQLRAGTAASLFASLATSLWVFNAVAAETASVSGEQQVQTIVSVLPEVQARMAVVPDLGWASAGNRTFTGTVALKFAFRQTAPASSYASYVRFERGARTFDSSGICVGSSSPDFGQREPVNKYGESPR